jgi:diacylglycerol kinase (ATP)
MSPKSEKKSKDQRLYNRNFIDACNNAVNGIVYSATTQTNIRKQLIIGAIVLILSLFYDFSTAEFLSLTFAVFFVIFAEMVNTAIETLVDLYVDQYHPKAKIAKDVGAGAVVLASVNSVIVAYFLILRETNLTQMNQSILSSMIASPTHLALVGLLLTVITIVALKSISKKKEINSGDIRTFNPSGQSMISFAILTAIWLNTQNIFVFCLALVLSLLVVGNRMNDTRTFGEVLFGALMGALIVLMVYGLTFLKG